ncbi:tRNA (cytidine(34)-2'-O)-methyltransferase [Aquirhabdus parva]|uniref:tRNA (cytidine(34)-2'-O)-methyltransferase n=1 Tax=Aquirhabdus parva TaxID=2283318 RepID=A0A345P6U0_9GAMM|nr:tRNA (cytidine(34)-2'-O)-methyltransferase [Aquirhabdus parva]AXI02999.1 tRNA (cytidine(34)-2'-O)-methyltransferase [Aquirhabdus parva]
MIHIILYQPEIPGNTGNIIRLCANTGAHLHLIEPLGFTLEDKQLRRAGLDYHEWARMQIWPDLESCLANVKEQGVSAIFPLTTKGSASPFTTDLNRPVAFLFGPETKGLPLEVREMFPAEHWLRLPMQPDSRSLNLSNSAAVMVYEAWRQQGIDV